VSRDLVQILEGNTFVVSDERGDIEASLDDPTGLFSFDTRFLSRWVLTVDGQRLNALSTDDLQYYESRFFLVPGTGTVYVDAKLSVIRQRSVAGGFHESLTILNHDEKPVKLEVRIEAASDFADLFEVKDALKKKGTYSSRVVRRKTLVLAYQRDTFTRETWITASSRARVDTEGLTFDVRIPPDGEWTTELDVSAKLPTSGEAPAQPAKPRGKRSRPSMARGLDDWLAAAPRLESDKDALRVTYRRSLVDLAALRFSTRTMPGRSLPAAGLPWFMTMFGRDSIFTSLQGLPFAPELAATTLRALGERQGSRVDDFRDEDPGRILHEMRYGEMTAFEERPHSPYYGTADATPLYVVLLDEYERWTGDTRLVRDLEYEARAALNWIDEYADLQGNGYVSYKRRNEKTGLENQCWKDSWDSISYHDGTLPGFPRATCELQGYAYDAKMRGARLARLVWRDAALAAQLEKEAADLKRRFNRDFWVERGEYFAVALDADGRQVDTLTSNIGHLL
jgi:glycogen debranching enzyme